MKERPLIQRSLLRRAVRKHLPTIKKDRRKLIRQTLHSSEIFEVFYEQSMAEAAQFATSSGQFNITVGVDGQSIADNLLSLFQWFIEHGPELIQLIERIAELFGSKAGDAGPETPLSNF